MNNNEISELNNSTESNVIDFGELGYTPAQIKNLEAMKDDLAILGIGITLSNVSELFEITPKEIKNVVRIKDEIQMLGITIDAGDITELSEITPEEIKNVINIRDELQIHGVKIPIRDIYDIFELSKFTPEEIKNVINIKDELHELGINIYTGNISQLSKFTPEEIKNVVHIKDEIQTLGIDIYAGNIAELSEISPEQIKNVINIRDEIQILGIDIYAGNISQLSEITPEQSKKLLPYKDMIDRGNIVQVSQLIGNSDIKVIKELLERKTSYLEKNRMLSDETFNNLFRPGYEGKNTAKTSIYDQFMAMLNNIMIRLGFKKENNNSENNNEIKKGKYGYGEIEQQSLGFCYAYTGFNLLKNSNFFEIMIKTSLRETPKGWEVRVPFGSKEGKIIKVSKDEINDSYFVLRRRTGEYKTYKSETTSQTTEGMKILEIAFIKQYILEHDDLNDKKSEHEYARNAYEKAIVQAKNSFQATGDFQLNGELLGAVEGGRTGEWFQHMLGDNLVQKKVLHEAQDVQKNGLFQIINNGLLKVMLDIDENNINRKDEIYINEKGKKELMF